MIYATSFFLLDLVLAETLRSDFSHFNAWSSGLGLDAQRRAAAGFVGSWQLVSEFTEIESGRRHTNRPQLLATLAECRRRRAVLLIARLDRLARNVAFISTLMENGGDFIACDMPTANRFTIYILAAVAEHEREMISKRTKAALAEAKRRGTQLGNPRIEQAQTLAQAAFRIKRPAIEVLALMRGWHGQRWTLRRIADELNRLGIRPSRGRQWYASSVRDQLSRGSEATPIGEISHL